MKRGKVVVIDSNNIRVEVQRGSAGGAIVLLLSVAVGVYGAVKICEIFGRERRDSGNGNVEAVQQDRDEAVSTD